MMGQALLTALLNLTRAHLDFILERKLVELERALREAGATPYEAARLTEAQRDEMVHDVELLMDELGERDGASLH